MERITKQELQKMYGVNRKTIETWRKEYGLPIIQIGTHKRYIRKEDLLSWEEKMMANSEIEV